MGDNSRQKHIRLLCYALVALATFTMASELSLANDSGSDDAIAVMEQLPQEDSDTLLSEVRRTPSLPSPLLKLM